MILFKYIQENLMVLWGMTLYKLLFLSFNNEYNFSKQAFALKTFFIIIFKCLNTLATYLKVVRNYFFKI